MTKKTSSQNHVCHQSDIISNLRIEQAQIKVVTSTVASDIQEIKVVLKEIQQTLITDRKETRIELDNKVSHTELHDKLQPLYQSVEFNKSTTKNIIDLFFRYGVPLIILLLLVANKLGMNIPI